jgi:hypothetical protein
VCDASLKGAERYLLPLARNFFTFVIEDLLQNGHSV